MSGRPSRNCKRRSASEMLGKSPALNQERSPRHQERKKAKLDVAASDPVPKSKPPAREVAGNETEVRNVAESSPSAMTEPELSARRSSRRTAIKNASPSKLPIKKPSNKEKTPVAVTKVQPVKVRTRKLDEAVVSSQNLVISATDGSKSPEEVIAPPMEDESSVADADVTSAEVDAQPAEVDILPAEVDISPAEVDIPSTEVDIPPTEVDIPPTEVVISHAEVDVSPAEVDISPAEVDISSATPQEEQSSTLLIDESPAAVASSKWPIKVVSTKRIPATITLSEAKSLLVDMNPETTGTYYGGFEAAAAETVTLPASGSALADVTGSPTKSDRRGVKAAISLIKPKPFTAVPVQGAVRNVTQATADNDSLTISDEKRDRTTLPERTDAIPETDLITLETEEIILSDHFQLLTDPKPAQSPVKQRLITANSVKPAAAAEAMLDDGSTGDFSNVLVEEASGSSQPVSDDGDPKMDVVAGPVTKTYIVDKNNRIQELLVQPSVSKPVKTAFDLANKSPSVDEHAGESDDEEFEHEDEDKRIDMESLDDDDDVIFGDKLPEGYDVDELVFSMFERIKPTFRPDHLWTFHAGSGYKCNTCYERSGLLQTSSKRDMYRHLKGSHTPDLAPWQCPICQFRCMYPLSLMLHMSMHTKNKPFTCDKCDKKFVYRHTLQMHLKYHDSSAVIKCNKSGCDKLFYEASSTEHHLTIRHNSGPIYEGDCRAIIEEGDTSLGDALDLLVGEEEKTEKAPQLYSVERGSIKINDMGDLTPRYNVSESGDNLPMTVVSESDIIGSTNSVVSIMPVSFQNESGLPETINVVITLPQGEGGKLIKTSNAGTPAVKQGAQLNNTDWLTKSRMMSVDKELHAYCEVLDQPIHYKNQRAFIKCTVCPAGLEVHFGSVTQFCEHLRKDHIDKDIKPYACSQCDYKCRVKGNLDQHVKFHSKDRPFVCSICSKGFIQRYKLNLHLKFHENKRDWVCKVCGSAFNDKQDLSRHTKNVHFTEAEAVKCPHCERTFKNEYMLSQHVHIHTGERNYKCDICEKLYSTKESLRSHMKGHQFQFGCEICAKPLGSYSAFIAHKRLHDPNQKGYQCEHCGKVLLFKATLEAHIKSIHSDVKDFLCPLCDKGFKTQAQLNNHKISHSKEKPYLCQICGYAVKRKDSLRQHMYRHADVKPYRCGRCGKEYTQKQALEIHLKSKHAGVTTFNCNMCDRGFNTNYLLKKHMQKAHEVELINKMPKSDQVIIAQQQMEEVAESEPPAPDDSGVLPPTTKKQTVLINAHICEHCHEVFVSQHALAVHILSEHMNQSRVNEYDASSIPTTAEDGQVVNISETIEIPIGEEMVLVQSVEPGVLSAALEKGASRVLTAPDGTLIKQTSSLNSPPNSANTVSLLSSESVKAAIADKTRESEGADVVTQIVVTDANVLEDMTETDGEEMRIVEVSGTTQEEVDATEMEQGQEEGQGSEETVTTIVMGDD